MWTLVSFLLFTGLVAVVSWLKTRGSDRTTADGYFLGGRSLRWYFIGGSLLLTNLSSEQMVGLNGNAYTNGMVVMAWEVVAAVTMVFMALYMLKEYLRRGIATTPDFVEQRFDRGVRNIFTAASLFGMIFLVMPFILYSGALALNAIFQTEELLGLSEGQSLLLMIVLTGVVGSIYAIGGGLRAVAVSDTINGVGLFIGGLLVPGFALVALGDGSFLEGVDTLTSRAPERLNPVGDEDADVPFSTLFTGMLYINFAYWCTTQYIIQRTLASGSLEQGQKGILFAATMKLWGPLYLVLPGIIAWHLLGPDLAKGDDAYPDLVQQVLPGWLAGFFGAVLFGAVLSSFNSTLNSAATIFSLNVYKPLRKTVGESELIAAGKVFGVVIALASICAAPFISKSGEGLFNLMKQLGSIFCALPVVILVGMFNPKVPAIAAKVAFFVGGILYIVLSFVLDNHVFGLEVHWLHTLAFCAAVPTAIMLVWGHLQPVTVQEPLTDSGTSRVDLKPWRFALPFGAFVLVAVVGVYLGLYWIGQG
ncbi:MAG: solute:sodium symporter family transporter [Opitutales bacterium]